MSDEPAHQGYPLWWTLARSRSCGYLLKDASPAELADAVRAAARGETVLSPSVGSTLVRQVRRPAAVTTAMEHGLL